MPAQKDLKRLVRERMRKTGESYTAARAQLVAKRAPAPKADAPLAKPGMSDAAVLRATGRTWAQWLEVLDAAGAKELSHRDIAVLAAERFGAPPWWSQMVTVGYERARGKRVLGQKSDGKFSVNKSKTLPMPVEKLWSAFMRCESWLGADSKRLRMSKATRPKSMRMKWDDGTPVVVNFYAKGATKSSLQLQHDGLASAADASRVREYWSEKLAEFAKFAASSKK